MKENFCKTLIIFSLFIAGCGNFNPRNQPKIDNQGNLDEVRSNQNGIMAEIGKLKQSSEIHDSQLKDIQNGLVNLNNYLSKNENSGIQILQGDGSLILVFSLCVIGMLLWYRSRAIESEKSASIMAKEIVKINDPVINDNILKEAILQNSESQIYSLLSKHAKNIR